MNKNFIRLFAFLVLCFFLFTACSVKDELPTEPPLEFVPNTDPEPWTIDPNEGFFLGIQTETEYKQIAVRSIKEVYSLKEDTYFACDVANEHIGHGFNLYQVVYIDKYVDGQWVRQCNTDAVKSQEFLSWSYVGSDGNTDGINKTRCFLNISDVLPQVTPGKYRLVVFTPLTTEYAEFEVIE